MDSTMPASTCSIERDRASGVLLHRLDHLADLLGRLHRAFGQPPDFVGHDREALPASPARAASIAALSASRLVWSAMPSITLTILPISSDRCSDRVDRLLQPLAAARGSSATDCWLTWSTWWTRRGDRADVLDHGARACRWPPRPRRAGPRRSGPSGVSVALICWIEAEVWSTFAASASAFLARCCICEAISTMVDEVSSVELDWVSAPLAIWVEEAAISSADVATAREEVGDLGGDLAGDS